MAFLLCMAFLSLLAVEVLLRVFFFDAPALRLQQYAWVEQEKSEQLGAGRPGSRRIQYVNLHKYINKGWYPDVVRTNPLMWRLMDQDLQYGITFNNYGFRNAFDIQIPKPTNVFRIVVLGDSFAFGDVVTDFDTIAFWLNYQLNKRSGTNAFFEVINAGFPGTTVNRQHELYTGRVEKTQPDILVLVHCGNDIAEMAESYQQAMLKYETDTPAAPNRIAFQVKQFFKISVFLRALNIFRRQWKTWIAKRKAESNIRQYKKYLTEKKERSRSELINAYIAELNAFVEELKVTKTPLLFVLYDSEPIASQQLSQACRAAQVPVVDMDSVFRDYGDRAEIKEMMYLFPYNYHPSRYGNYLTARQILSTLLDKFPEVQAHIQPDNKTDD